LLHVVYTEEERTLEQMHRRILHAVIVVQKRDAVVEIWRFVKSIKSIKSGRIKKLDEDAHRVTKTYKLFLIKVSNILKFNVGELNSYIFVDVMQIYARC